MTKAIEAERLAKTYPGGVEAVRGVDFTVEPGEVFGLLGPNGAGKSTTIGMLTGTIRPTGGSARLAGFDVAKRPLTARAVSSVVYQEAVVDRSLTGRRNLDLHARLWRVPQREAQPRVEELAAALGLRDLLDRPVGGYSGGERRRLELARALVSRPLVLFLDEPTVGLDPLVRAELLDLIGGLRDRHELTIMLTTHYLDEAERLCDRIAVVHEGLVVALDTPAALLRALGREIVELRVEGDGHAALDVLRANGLANGNSFAVGSTLTLPLADGASGTVAEIAALGLPTRSLTSRPPTLDDVYLRLTGGRLADAA